MKLNTSTRLFGLLSGTVVLAASLAQAAPTKTPAAPAKAPVIKMASKKAPAKKVAHTKKVKHVAKGKKVVAKKVDKPAAKMTAKTPAKS